MTTEPSGKVSTERPEVFPPVPFFVSDAWGQSWVVTSAKPMRRRASKLWDRIFAPSRSYWSNTLQMHIHARKPK